MVMIFDFTEISVLSEQGQRRLKEWLERKQQQTGLPNKPFAKKLGISEGTLNNYKHLIAPPKLQQLEILAKYEGVTTGVFLEFLEGRVVSSRSLETFMQSLT